MTYPEKYKDLTKGMKSLSQDLPGTLSAFTKLHEAAAQEGELSTKTKELIALGIAITVRCNGCISYHVHDALKSGASYQEVVETIGVAVLMGGGPSVVYGVEAHDALKQFQEQGID